MLLAGGDLIASFGHPGVWAPNDVSFIVLFKKKKKAKQLQVTSYCWTLWLCYYRKNWYRCVWIFVIA